MRFPLLFSSFSFGGGDGALGFELLLLLLGNEVMDIINGAKIKQNHGGDEVHMPIIEGGMLWRKITKGLISFSPQMENM